MLASKQLVRSMCCVLGPSAPRIKVTLLGCDTALGANVAFQLKLKAVVPEVKMHGSGPTVRDLAEDLSMIPTSSRFVPYSGPNQLKQALNKADVVFIYSEAGCHGMDVSDETLFNLNAPLVEKIAKSCVSVCPEAIFALLIPPLNSTLPLFAQVLKENGVLKAGKLVGVVSDMTMTARKLVAKLLGLNPKTVWIPITGGGSPKTLVPVITGAKPGGVFLNKEAEKVSEQVRSVRKNIKKENNNTPGSIAAGTAVADFIKAICKGLMGEETEAHPAMIRMRVVEGVDYMVVPVHFGPSGVSETHGIPDMTAKDQELLDAAVREMMDEQERALLYLSKKKTACVACEPPSALPAFGDECVLPSQ